MCNSLIFLNLHIETQRLIRRQSNLSFKGFYSLLLSVTFIPADQAGSPSTTM